MIKYVIFAMIAGMLSAFSQILLKKSTEKERTGFLGEYLNPLVISGYGIMVLSMLLTVMSYKGIPFKYGAVLESLVYLYIMVLSRIFLKEKLTGKKIIGNLIIIAGVILFSLGK